MISFLAFKVFLCNTEALIVFRAFNLTYFTQKRGHNTTLKATKSVQIRLHGQLWT